MRQGVPEIVLCKFVLYPGCVYIIFPTCADILNAVVLMKG